MHELQTRNFLYNSINFPGLPHWSDVPENTVNKTSLRLYRWLSSRYSSRSTENYSVTNSTEKSKDQLEVNVKNSPVVSDNSNDVRLNVLRPVKQECDLRGYDNPGIVAD